MALLINKANKGSTSLFCVVLFALLFEKGAKRGFVWVEKLVLQSYTIVVACNKRNVIHSYHITHIRPCPSSETKQPANNEYSLSRRLICFVHFGVGMVYLFFLGLLEFLGES
jgi:hypothetical protein